MAFRPPPQFTGLAETMGNLGQALSYAWDPRTSALACSLQQLIQQRNREIAAQNGDPRLRACSAAR